MDITANTPPPPRPSLARVIAPKSQFPLPLLQQPPLECHLRSSIPPASSPAPAWPLTLVSKLFHLQWSLPHKLARRFWAQSVYSIWHVAVVSRDRLFLECRLPGQGDGHHCPASPSSLGTFLPSLCWLAASNVIMHMGCAGTPPSPYMPALLPHTFPR